LTGRDTRRAAAPLVVCVLVALFFGSSSAASVQGTGQAPCGPHSAALCSTVDVPLDPTGVVPGTVALHVTEVLPQGTPRGAIFLIAGGPGQGSAHVLGLGTPQADSLDQALFPGYALIAYDDRGTGDSGLLDCPALQSATTSDAENAQVGPCAAALGPARDFYSTANHVADLEAVRQSLGFDKVALYGTSYGTKLAVAYALAYPTHVERLLLDSVLPPELPDPFSANVVATMPKTLAAFCAGGICRGATTDYAGDVVAVANALATKPLRGRVRTASGGSVTVTLGAIDFLSTILDSDLNPGLADELPSVVHAARLGNGLPLLRIYRLDAASAAESAPDLSSALYAATSCHDGPFPWQPDTPIADRQALVQAAVAALPAGSFGPFGTWAAGFGNAEFCLNWPSPAGGVALGAGPLPDVPVLAISGGYDMRTPTAGAVSVVARFPQGHVLVVPGIGHSVLGADPSGCAQRAVLVWMQGGAVPSTCARPKQIVPVAPGYPASPTAAGSSAQTYSAAAKTVAEAKALWLETAGLSGTSTSVGGLYGGKVVETARTITFVGYQLASGVSLSGTLRLKTFGPPSVFDGAVTVGGSLAAPGLLGVVGASVRGTLGGRPVG
jgi:pimeloyl-ACP methyl ester carboxylesterase